MMQQSTNHYCLSPQRLLLLVKLCISSDDASKHSSGHCHMI